MYSRHRPFTPFKIIVFLALFKAGLGILKPCPFRLAERSISEPPFAIDALAIHSSVGAPDPHLAAQVVENLPEALREPLRLPIQKGQDNVLRIFRRIEYVAQQKGQPFLKSDRPGYQTLDDWRWGNGGGNQGKIENELAREGQFLVSPAVLLRTGWSPTALWDWLMTNLFTMKESSRMMALRQWGGLSRSSVNESMGFVNTSIREFENGKAFLHPHRRQRHADIVGYKDVYLVLAGMEKEKFLEQVTGTGEEVRMLIQGSGLMVKEFEELLGLDQTTSLRWRQVRLPQYIPFRELQSVLEKRISPKDFKDRYPVFKSAARETRVRKQAA